MVTFKTEKPITSCTVSRDLLEDLEAYLTTRLPQLVQVPAVTIRGQYSLSVTDNSGIEKLTSIHDYTLPLFSDTTERAHIDLHLWSPDMLRVAIVFDKSRRFSEIIIECSSETARETTISVYDAIKRIIETRANNNWIFNPDLWLYGTISGIASGLLVSSAGFWSLGHDVWPISLSIALLLGVYATLGKRLKPYTAFVSKSYADSQRFADWLLYGLLTFLVFQTAFVSIRRLLIGF